jgi:HPt (histidine-containing phosphotransfer) domain-containing protein
MERAYEHIDPLALREATGHDEAAFALLARMFIDTAPPLMARVRAAAVANDAAALHHHCHELRGSAVLLGARQLNAALALHERRVAGGGAVPDAAALDALDALLALACAEVARALAAGAPAPARAGAR